MLRQGLGGVTEDYGELGCSWFTLVFLRTVEFLLSRESMSSNIRGRGKNITNTVNVLTVI